MTINFINLENKLWYREFTSAIMQLIAVSWTSRESLHPKFQKKQWAERHLGSKQLLGQVTQEQSTFHISEHLWMCSVLMTCTWALCHVLGLCAARPVPPAPGGSFQTGLQMLLAAFCYDLDPWQTGMWQMSLVSEKLSSEKFFTRKCKEGVHINGIPCTCSFFGPWESLPLESQEKGIYLVSRKKRGLGVNW